MPALIELTARNFRSLRHVAIPLRSLSVLVGPNNAGKSNVLDLIRFLSDSVRFDLSNALDMRGGYDRVRFRGRVGDSRPASVSIGVKANVTTHASLNAPDEYNLTFRQMPRKDRSNVLLRQEQFRFKRHGGRGRRITIKGARAHIIDEKPRSGETAS